MNYKLEKTIEYILGSLYILSGIATIIFSSSFIEYFHYMVGAL